MWTLLGVLAVLALALLIGTLSRCSHRHATLLPPVRGAGPDRDHARWYCDRCGKTWDSGLESSTRPRVIYQGYDENKAVRAAVRAEALDKQRRRLATKRGGSNRNRQPARPAPVTRASRSGPRPIETVTVMEQRAVGFSDDGTVPFVAARRARE